MSFGHLIKNEIDRQERAKKSKITDIEVAVEKLINDYGAPDAVSDEIKDFLLTSGNLYAIIELVKNNS